MWLWILVVLQFGFAAFLVLSVDWWPVPLWVLFIGSPGIALAVWAWVEIGLSKLRVHPSSTNATSPAKDGPYAIVRHPMYTGLLWFTAATFVAKVEFSQVFAWIGLAVVLWGKSQVEEKSLLQRFAEYQAYRNRVGRFLPRVFE